MSHVAEIPVYFPKDLYKNTYLIVYDNRLTHISYKNLFY